MTEKMQADDVLSRQAVFVRCCLRVAILIIAQVIGKVKWN